MPELLTDKKKNTFDPNNAKVLKMIKQATNPILLKLYLMSNLPMAWFMGLKLKSLTPFKSEATIPYGWRSQNPFKSIYFIAQAGAAEFPAGIMAKIAITDRGKSISMLVRHVESEFFKKATSKTTFTCEDGLLIQETVQKALDTGEGQTCVITSTGRIASGEVVSITKLTWSFRVKT